MRRSTRMKQKPDAGSAGALNLVKLCVGADDVADLDVWQRARSLERAAQGLDPRPRHVTRQFPRRADELLDGGSLYWVIRGVIRARQRLEAIEPVDGEDGLRRHALILSTQIVLTEPAPRRAFQGWRYLTGDDAPRDLDRRYTQNDGDPLPTELREAVAAFGVV